MQTRYFYVKQILLISVLINQSILFSQKKWEHDLKTPKEFIENKGQFDGKIKSSNAIKFAANVDGLQIYFTSKGLTYQIEEIETERKERKKSFDHKSTKKMTAHVLEEEREREMEQRKIRSHFIEMNWVNANPSVEIKKELEVSNYYTYNNPKDVSGKTGIKANAYQKITYHNLYPNIDVEYFFPNGKSGMKYNIILHPGANPDDIQIHYSKSGKCILDHDGNLNISFDDQRIKEYAPVSYYENFTSISSKFVVYNNNIQFKMDKYDTSKKVIIDPWVINPSFTYNNKAFDVDYDYSGNVYVLSSSDIGDPIVKKFTNTGALQWTYSVANSGGFGSISCYGDFALDRTTGNSYIAFGIEPVNIYKLNNTGVQVQSVTSSAVEIWRLAYNQCTNQLICGSGNMVGTNADPNFVTYDSNLGSQSTYAVESDLTDITALTLSKDGTSLFYLSTYCDINQTTQSFSVLPSKLHKISTTNPSSLNYLVDSGYLLMEVYSNSYSVGVGVGTVGYNGITASKHFSYTSDGYQLKKWDQQSGTLIASTQITPTVMWDPIGIGQGVVKIQWGGIDVDECENIYVGFNNTIRKYDANLVLISTISLSDTVYDVLLSDHNTIYACGSSFLGEYSLTPPPPLSMEHTNPTSCGLCDGTATIIGICHEGIDNFSFSWNTVPVQTNDTATNLCPGTYTVTVTKNGCIPILYYTGTVTIDGGSGPAIFTSLTSTIASCTTNDGTATVVATGGTPPFSYSWNSTPIQTAATATNLPSGMISVTVTDNEGCFKKDSILVTSQNTLDVTTSSLPISCITNEGTASVFVSGGTPNYSYNWSNGATTSSTQAVTSGMYSVTVTDDAGCVSEDSVLVAPTAIPISIASSNSPICEGTDLNLTATNSSIVGSTYYWTGPNNFTSNLQNPNITSSALVDAGDYIVTVTANDCSSSSTVSVVVHEIPVSTASVNTPICAGQNLYLTATNSQIANSTYNWTGPNNFTSNQKDPVILAATVNATGLYTLSVLANACSSSSTTNAIVNAIPTTIATSNSPICEGETLLLNATANTLPGSTYVWSGPLAYSSTVQNSEITPSLVTNSGVYKVITTANGCVDTSEVTVLINPIPLANFSADILKGCEPLEVKFTDLSVPASSSVVWNFGDGTTSTATGIVPHTFTTVGDYDISLQSSTSGCSNTKTQVQMIHVVANAEANFTPSPLSATIFDPLIHFTNTSINANAYSWDFGDNSNSNLSNPSHTYVSEPSDYVVQLIANNADDCPDTSEITIKILEPLIFYVPNAFTPDGNKFNETFIPVMTSGFDPKSYEMRIYNRWGEMVFETNDTLIGWDGKYKGEKVADGIFTWVITFKDKVTDKMYSYNGHVNVLK